MWLRSGMVVAVTYAGSCSSDSPLAWELPHAVGVALKSKEKEKVAKPTYWHAIFSRFVPILDLFFKVKKYPF